MQEVLRLVRCGQMIPAINGFRALYGCGLKEAKDACDALRDALKSDETAKATEFLVVHENGSWSADFSVVKFGPNHAQADAFAAEHAPHNDKTYVVAVLAESFEVTTKVMKAA